MPPRKQTNPLARKSAQEAPRQSSGEGCCAFLAKQQVRCGKPVVPGQNVCAGHGGLSTGPRTEAGIARLADRLRVHGRETRALRRLRSLVSHQLREKERELYAIGLIHGPRIRGRKPSLWAQGRSIAEFRTEVQGTESTSTLPNTNQWEAESV